MNNEIKPALSENPSTTTTTYRSYCFGVFKNVAFRWTPRGIAGYYVGIYGLGYAYKNGIMIRIQFKAIEVLYPRIGYAGLGAAMPRIDWYAASAVQSLCTIIGGILYDLIERICIYLYSKIFSNKKQVNNNSPAQIV